MAWDIIAREYLLLGFSAHPLFCRATAHLWKRLVYVQTLPSPVQCWSLGVAEMQIANKATVIIGFISM